MSREDAWQVLTSTAELDFVTLGDVFAAYGFVSTSPSFETDVYYHPRFRCGAFTARDDGLRVVTDGQRGLVRRMVQCVEAFEKALGSA